MLIFFVRRYKITFIWHIHISDIIKTVSSLKKASLNKNKFYLCFVYFTIYFLFRSIFSTVRDGEGGIITTDTLCSRTPRWSPSLRKRKIRLSTWSWPSAFGSWWGRSRGPSDRPGDTPPGEFYWWRYRFYDPCDAWAARVPSLLGTWALRGKRDRKANEENHFKMIYAISIWTLIMHLTCFTDWSSISRLALAYRISVLFYSALSMHAVLPPAAGRLLPPVTVLTRVSFFTWATVRGALWHAQTMHTPARTQRKHYFPLNVQVREKCVIGICCVPAAQTGILGAHLFTQWAALTGGTLARHAHLPSLSAGPLSTNAAGVTAWQDALSPCQSTAQVLQFSIETYVMNAAIEGLEWSVWTRSQACLSN